MSKKQDEQKQDKIESDHVLACHSCAVRNGHTFEEADKCRVGSVGCPDCPFK